MTKITTEKILPIDFLYEVNGGEDRRNADEALVLLYELLIEKKEYVDRFNSKMDATFANGARNWEFVAYLTDEKNRQDVLNDCVLSVEKDNQRIVSYLVKYYGLLADNLTNV